MAFWHKNQKFNSYRLEEIDTESLDKLIDYFESMIYATMDFDGVWQDRLDHARYLKENPAVMEVMASVLIPKRRYWWQ